MDPNTFSEHVRTERELTRIALQVAKMAEESGLSRREIAQRMGMLSPSTVQRTVSGANVTLETLMRFATACGFRMNVAFEPMEAPRTLFDLRGYTQRHMKTQWTTPDSATSQGDQDGALVAA